MAAFMIQGTMKCDRNVIFLSWIFSSGIYVHFIVIFIKSIQPPQHLWVGILWSSWLREIMRRIGSQLQGAPIKTLSRSRRMSSLFMGYFQILLYWFHLWHSNIYTVRFVLYTKIGPESGLHLAQTQQTYIPTIGEGPSLSLPWPLMPPIKRSQHSGMSQVARNFGQIQQFSS